MELILRASMIELTADADPSKKWDSRWVEVVPVGIEITEPRWEMCVPQYRLMCEAIMCDIQTVTGSGANELENIRIIESGEMDLVDPSGNAWVTYITRDKVWFEGLYNQGEGGEVSFAQYKLAVQTYVKFLADPEHKPIEVEWPEA